MEYLWHGGKPSSGDQNTFHPPHLNNFKDVQTEHQLLTLQSLVVGPYSGKIIAFNFKLKFLGCQWSVSALTVHPHVTGVFTSFVGSCAFLHHPLCSAKSLSWSPEQPACELLNSPASVDASWKGTLQILGSYTNQHWVELVLLTKHLGFVPNGDTLLRFHLLPYN